MQALFAPSPLQNPIRFSNWQKTVKVGESLWNKRHVIPQARDIALVVIRRLKKKELIGFSDAHLWIVEQELTNCLKLHMSMLSMGENVYRVSLKKDGDFISASVQSEKVAAK